MARGRSRPERTWGRTGETMLMTMGTSPVTASSTWRLLEYGTCSKVVLVRTERLAPAKCACVPMPEVPYDTLPGFARA